MMLVLVEMRGDLVDPNRVDQVEAWIEVHMAVGKESGRSVRLARVLVQRAVDRLLHAIIVLLPPILLRNQVESVLRRVTKGVSSVMGPWRSVERGILVAVRVARERQLESALAREILEVERPHKELENDLAERRQYLRDGQRGLYDCEHNLKLGRHGLLLQVNGRGLEQFHRGVLDHANPDLQEKRKAVELPDLLLLMQEADLDASNYLQLPLVHLLLQVVDVSERRITHAAAK